MGVIQTKYMQQKTYIELHMTGITRVYITNLGDVVHTTACTGLVEHISFVESSNTNFVCCNYWNSSIQYNGIYFGLKTLLSVVNTSRSKVG